MTTYKEAGVDIDAGIDIVKDHIIPAMRMTYRPGFPFRRHKQYFVFTAEYSDDGTIEMETLEILGPFDNEAVAIGYLDAIRYEPRYQETNLAIAMSEG